MKQRLFIGSSTQAKRVAEAVQAQLDGDEFEATVWDQGVFKLSRDALDSLLNALDHSDAGIFILRADDLTIREASAPGEDRRRATVRDNVVFELGMFIGRFGRDRAFMLTPERDAPELPSDLEGVTTAVYDGDAQNLRSAVGRACTEVREALTSDPPLGVSEPPARMRLNRAISRMSEDLQALVVAPKTQARPSRRRRVNLSGELGTTKIFVESGRIENYSAQDHVVALPANEYFDDECIADVRSALGAYVQRHFADSQDAFRRAVAVELTKLESERMLRREGVVADSYGIGQAIYLHRLCPRHRLILVSATTDRAAVGLRAEPHFLYAAMRGTIEKMKDYRELSLVIPVLGSGHGGVPVPVALLFNLLAARWCVVRGEPSLPLNELHIVLFEGGAIDHNAVKDVFERVFGSS
jgi:CAP12/Pycsar effector protein, TIR domain/Thoeris protein ThsA, Macro domain